MDYENSQQAREFLRTYVNGNRKLITDLLDGSGTAEDVGSHLLCIMLEGHQHSDQLALGSLGWLGSFTPSSFLWAFSEKHI